MQDISGFGGKVALNCSVTFPAGISISQFADDSDPLEFAPIEIADKAMGVNGDMITWAKAIPIAMVLNVIPGSPDDVNLQILFDNNRPSQGKIVTADIIQAVVTYPDGTVTSFGPGRIMMGPPGKSIASSGRIKTRTYTFALQNKVGA